MLGDSQYLLDALDDWAFRGDWTVRVVAMDTLRALPRFVTSGVNFDSEDLRSRLLGRLGWYLVAGTARTGTSADSVCV